jgi:excisionase family DNA binding protein
METTDDRHLVDSQRSSAILKLSTDLIYKLAQQGKIPASKVGAAWRFKKEKIDQWMDANENRHQRRVRRKE